MNGKYITKLAIYFTLIIKLLLFEAYVLALNIINNNNKKIIFYYEFDSTLNVIE